LIFSTNLPIETLLSLKTVERVLVLILFEKFNEPRDVVEGQAILDLVENQFKFDFKSTDFATILHNWTEKLDANTDQDESEDSNLNKKMRKSFTFRVDCKLTGKWRKLNEVKKSLVALISKKVSEQSCLENSLESPDLIVTCHLTELCFIIGLALTKNSLSLRGYIRNVGLRSTICAAMIQIANLDRLEGDFTLILDPFCGKSTIQNEYLEYLRSPRFEKHFFFICADGDAEQIERSRENLRKYETKKPLYDFILNGKHANSSFSYRDKCVDLIITDLPFGKNHPIKYHHSNHGQFYRKLLIEMDRLLARPDGVCVLLLNSNETNIFDQELKDLSEKGLAFFKMASKHPVSLGETNAHIYKIVTSPGDF
jgi:23S rRNA G2445 N2-methylase RlmL